MSGDIKVGLTLRWLGAGAVTTGANAARASIKGIGDSARAATQEFKRLHDAVNGFSAASKMIASVGVGALLRDTENTALAFKRIQLELKQTAGLTNEQVAQISDYAKDSAAAMLSTPTAMLEGAMKLANAGMKWADLLPVLKQAAADAAAFRASVGEMANMDFDISTKMRIDSKDLSSAHNMLLYHARSGRFEAPAMSRGAPELFTYASKVGISGTQGLNLIGAMTQQVMKGIAPDQQTKVLTDFEQGFSHIVTPHYLKGLQKVGIDVKKFMPNGQFYGNGGVQGFMDLVRAMKAKGLEDPFKLADAGFADKETKDFWFQMMKGVDSFDQSMREASEAAKSSQTTRDREEISNSSVGQDQQARAKYEARQLDADGGVSVWERLKNKAADNPITSAASAVALAAGARTLWKKRQAGKDAAEKAQQASNALMPQNVFVMNWPKSLGVAGTLPSQPVPGTPGESLPSGNAPGKEGKMAKMGRLAVLGTAAVSELAAVGYASYQITSALMETEPGQKFAGWLADQAMAVTNAFASAPTQQVVDRGNKPADQAKKQAEYLNVSLHLDGEQIAAAVNARNTRESRRN